MAAPVITGQNGYAPVRSYLSNEYNEHGAMPGEFGQEYGGANYYANQLATTGAGFLNQTAPNPYDNQFGASLTGDAANFGADQTAQAGSLAQLYAASQGTGPNVAADTMKAGLVQSQGQQTALAKSSGIGGGGSLAARNALNQNATAGINNANATAQVNATQRANALTAYNQAANQYAEGSRAGQQNQQQMGSAYAQMQETQNQQNAANQIAWQQMGNQVEQGQLTADSDWYGAAQNVDTQGALANNAANNSANAALMGAGLSLVGAGASAAAQGSNISNSSSSDARVKEDIESEGDHSLADQFLDHLHPYSFKYKNEEDEPSVNPHGGRYLGVMAQDVERAPYGDQIVADTSRGKVLQGGPSIGAALAGLGQLHERVAMLEERASKMKGRKS